MTNANGSVMANGEQPKVCFTLAGIYLPAETNPPLFLRGFVDERSGF
ncbi:hypothetical protein FBY13_107240 [Pantoea sp. SJZ147]|nr:hypothetical protein FBY13_107240 [Pantoea sp. SJZ147]